MSDKTILGFSAKTVIAAEAIQERLTQCATHAEVLEVMTGVPLFERLAP